MRRLLRVVGVLAMVIGFPTAAIALLTAMEFDSVKPAKVEPQSIRLADLAKNGHSDNAHVEVTEYTFGKPVKIEKDGGWAAVWIPLLVPGRTKVDTPPAFLHTTLVHDKAQLDALLEQKSFRGLVGSAMGNSRWNVAPSAMLYEQFPKFDPSKTTVLTDVGFVVDGKVIIPGEKLLDPKTAELAWMVTAGGGGVTVVGLLLWLLGRTKTQASGGRGGSGGRRQVDLLNLERLPDHDPTSTHGYTPGGVMKRGGAYIVGGLVTLVLGFGLVSMAASSMKKGQGGTAMAAGLGAMLFLGLSVYVLKIIYQEVLNPITRVALYRGGI